MTLRPVLLGVALVVAGCGAPSSSVILGTGSASFVPIASGDVIPIYLGCQGLHYIEGSVLTRGITAHNAGVKFSLFRSDGSLINASAYVVDLTPLDPTTLPGGVATACPGSNAAFCLPGTTAGWGEVLGEYVLTGHESDIATIIGTTLRLQVDVTNADGSGVVSDDHTFTTRDGGTTKAGCGGA